jgi:short-subunit dehydrogenase
MESQKGKNAILTGASQGIGRHIAVALAREGINLLLVARNHENLEATAGMLKGHGIEVEVASADITDPDQRRNIPLRARNLFDQIDILVNNAGIEDLYPFSLQDPDLIEATYQTNLLAPVALSREILPWMLERGSGHIINIASLAGKLGMPFASVYASSKAGLIEWSISTHAELLDTGVKVSVICPGFVGETGMFARKHSKAPASLGLSKPEAVADAVVEALKTGKPEIIVNPRPVRPLMALRAISPGAMLCIVKRLGLIGFLKALAYKRHEAKSGQD